MKSLLPVLVGAILILPTAAFAQQLPFVIDPAASSGITAQSDHALILALVQRIQTLESRLAVLDAKQNIPVPISKDTQKLADLQNQLLSLQATYTSLNDQWNSQGCHTGKCTTLRATIGTVGSQISALQTQIVQLKTLAGK